MVKNIFWRIKEKRARKGNYETPKPINNYKNKIKNAYHISERIPESSVGKKVLVFDNVNEILFHVTREKVGFKFNDFDSKGQLIQKKDKKTENKEAKKRYNPFTDDFVEGLTRGMIDQDSKIKKSFLGKTIKFKNNGIITNCFVTLDKINRRFGDFTYENEVTKKMPILSNTSNEKRPKYKDLNPKKKKRQTVEPIKEKKPRKKKKPGKKKEPWEYEGKSFLDKYNGGK